MRAKEVGERVRQVRKKLGLTQGEFAKLLGVTRISVARYEAGRVPGLNLLRHIARLGGVSLGSILQEMPAEEGLRHPDNARSYRDIPEPARALITFLKGELAKLTRLPKASRKQYDDRLHELLARVTQDLEDYRHILTAGGRPLRPRGKQSVKKRRTL